TSRDPEVRFSEHANSGTDRANLQYSTMPGSGNLTETQQRLYEQSLINQYGLQKNGGQLVNKINSISNSSPLYSSVQNFSASGVANSTPSRIGNNIGNFIGTYNYGNGVVVNY